MNRIISFHNDNIPPEIIQAQKSVFDHFGISLEQIETQLYVADAIDHFISNESWTNIVLFDIDCIPLNRDVIKNYLILGHFGLTGAIQHAAHIPDSIDYVSPAFLILNKAIFERMGKPSFCTTSRSDVGGELTYCAHEKNIPVFFLDVVHVEEPKWELSNGKMFGIGTTYKDGIYHAFQSRLNNAARALFIQKCREVVQCLPQFP